MSGSSESAKGLLVTKLFANHVSVIHIPSVIANRSPLTIKKISTLSVFDVLPFRRMLPFVMANDKYYEDIYV